MIILDILYQVITTLLSVCMAYQFLYMVIGFFAKKKRYPNAKTAHSFGIVIAARNESAVIGNLLESIKRQNYDGNRVKIFVVADNCTDDHRTAEICRSHGAIVYERFDPTHARKGYALEFLFDQIERDYGIDRLDGYVFFDADNLLHPNYLSEINKAFDTGVDIAVGYRNSKNFARNPISSAYGIHFYRSSMSLHRPRARLGLPTHIAGTGYVMRASLLANGWHFTSLTEDTQFTLTHVAAGRHIAFCEAAEFYDEQPYEIKVMIRQRLRWAKGRLFCFFRCGGRLFAGIFKRPPGGKRFACYDMFFYALPKALLSACLSLIFTVVTFLAAGFLTGSSSTAGDGDLWGTLANLLKTLLTSYLGFAVMGALTVIRERRHIKCATPKLILYVFTYPLFDLIGLPISIASLFMRVKWKPIKHDEAIKVEELVSADELTGETAASSPPVALEIEATQETPVDDEVLC